MIYRATISLAFTDSKHAGKAIEKALEMFPYSAIINPGQPNQEIGYIQIEKCYHDEDPVKPCEIIFYQDNSPLPP